ncbi:MAG: HlyC/CorC family transporter [Candidatus Sericytochromatia bacterium]|nr:HlyC/CorC family transporter [Candidatus Sericytochromatia bacterium]
MAGGFAAGETAFRNLHRARLQNRAENGDTRAESLLRLMAHPQRLLSTILVGKTLCRAAATVLGVSLAPQSWLQSTWGLVGLILLTTVTLFTVSEVLPRALAARATDTVALVLDRPLRLCMFILAPFVKLLSIVTGPFLRVLGADFGQIGTPYTEEEIRTMVDLGEESGVLDREETELVHSVLAFDETLVSAVLTPRVDMVCTPVEATLDDALRRMVAEGYSRLPVFQDGIDHIVGIITLKDMLLAKQAKPDGNAPVSFYMRPAYHVPETKRIDELLREMQLRRLQMVVVSDEYGGTAGLVTLEDLLEEIVGEIRDEHDYDEQPPLVAVDERTVLVDARLGVDEVNDALRVSLPNSQTVGGLVFNTLGRVPELGETVRINNVELRVEQLEGIRVQKVRVHKLRTGTVDLMLMDEDRAAAEGAP